MTISDLFREYGKLTVADPIKLVCDLYKSFVTITGSNESLDHFYSWGQLLLADFDDLDKNIANADKVFECPTEPVLDGEVVGGASMTDLMIRDDRYQIAIEGKYTEYAWGPNETLKEWLSQKRTVVDFSNRRRIARAWLNMIGRAGCTGLHSSGELFAECGEIGYQFLGLH